MFRQIAATSEKFFARINFRALSESDDVGFYYLEARYGEPGDYAGPDLLAEWYRRNVRIYNNVMKLVATPEDRVLVIFGAGHLGWLRVPAGAR